MTMIAYAFLQARRLQKAKGEKESPARRLELQGGVMSPDEVEAFLAVPFAAEALQLRRWDDQAKDPKAVTPDLAHYQRLITTAFVVPPSKGK